MKKIYKIDDDSRVIDGVCGGIAEYFDMDPVLVRVLFGVSLLFSGAGLLIYIVCALAFPRKSEVLAAQSKVVVDGEVV